MTDPTTPEARERKGDYDNLINDLCALIPEEDKDAAEDIVRQWAQDTAAELDRLHTKHTHNRLRTERNPARAETEPREDGEGRLAAIRSGLADLTASENGITGINGRYGIATTGSSQTMRADLEWLANRLDRPGTRTSCTRQPASADTCPTCHTEPAEPTLRDVMAAAHQARLRLRCEIDNSYTDGEDSWRHREYAIAPFGDDGELGRLIFQTGECTIVCISTRTSDSFSTLTDPTPGQVLNAARAAGLMGADGRSHRSG